MSETVYTVTILSVDDEGNEEKAIINLPLNVDNIAVYMPNVTNVYFATIEPHPTKYIADFFESWVAKRITAKSKDKSHEIVKQYREEHLNKKVVNQVFTDSMKRFGEKHTPIIVIEDKPTQKVVENMEQWIGGVEAVQPIEPNKPTYSENAPNEPPENEAE